MNSDTRQKPALAHDRGDELRQNREIGGVGIQSRLQVSASGVDQPALSAFELDTIGTSRGDHLTDAALGSPGNDDPVARIRSLKVTDPGHTSVVMIEAIWRMTPN